MKSIRNLFVSAAILFLVPGVQAQDNDADPERALEVEKTTSGNPAVYNFDADVILGDRKTPDILFQSGSQTVGFDALLLNRSDFNDFLRNDFKRVPDLSEVESK